MNEKISFLPISPLGRKHTKMARFSADRYCYVLITVNCTLSRDLTPKAPGSPKIYHIPYNVTHISESSLFPVGWEGRSTQHHCWDHCSLGYRTQVTKLRFEGIPATPKHLCLFSSCISSILKVKSIGK